MENMFDMRSLRGLLTTPVILLVVAAFSPVASAQATRTWVSGVGDDANPCSRTAPCKTFAGAIAKTVSGGEISVLDPGGFGAVTITKPITLNGEGTLGSILVAGTNGINVAAPAGAVVRIIHLKIVGISQSGSGGLTGINFTSGKALIIEDSKIYDFNTSCVTANGAGLQVQISNSTLTNCNSGLVVNGGAKAEIRESDVTFNTTAGITAGQTGTGTGGIVNADRCNLSYNGTAALGGTSGFINLANNLVSYNTLGVNANGGGISNFVDPVGTTTGLTNTFVNNTADGIIPSGAGINVTKK
jgi:hypothetical protein